MINILKPSILWTWRFVCKSIDIFKTINVKIFGKLFMEPWQKYQILQPISTNQLWNPSTDIHQSNMEYFSRFLPIIQFKIHSALQTGLNLYKHNNGIMCSFDVWSFFTTTWWNNTKLSRQAARPFRCLVSSVGRAPVYCAGGRGFEPQTGTSLRVLK